MGLRHYIHAKAFYWILNWYKQCLQKYWIVQSRKNHKIWIILDDTLPDMINNKNLKSIVTELFTRGKKLNILLVFITKRH